MLGQCDEVTCRYGQWQRARQQEMLDSNGRMLGFVITVYAWYCLACSDADLCVAEFTKYGYPEPRMRATTSRSLLV